MELFNFADIPTIAWKMSLGIELTNDAADTVKNWVVTNNIVVEPDLTAWIIAFIWAFIDIISVFLIVFLVSKSIMKKWEHALIPATIAAGVMAYLFNPIHEAEITSIGVAQFLAFIELDSDWSYMGWIAIAVAVLIYVIAAAPEKHTTITKKVLYYIASLVVVLLAFTFIIDRHAEDPGVVIGLFLINFTFIFMLIALFLKLMGELSKTMAGTRTNLWVWYHAMLYAMAFVWISVMYSDFVVNIGSLHIPISVFVLVGTLGFAAISILIEGHRKKITIAG